MTETSTDPKRFVKAIAKSGLSIYDPIEPGHPRLWIPTSELEVLLGAGLQGVSLAGLALRTRSKAVKEHVCRILGYPIPRSFRRTRPRFAGQDFDIYVQKSNNLQIWNEELAPCRRYVLIRVTDESLIARVKVVTGKRLSSLDTTGTLTHKFQARCIPGDGIAELIGGKDTNRLQPFVSPAAQFGANVSPVSNPSGEKLLPIVSLFERMRRLVGTSFPDTGDDQERNRGAALHRLVCSVLGYSTYQDDGQFPDVRHQLLEVKLQTSPTIDLGLVRPNSTEALDVPQIAGKTIRHCDVRYAIFCAQIHAKRVTLSHLILSTGEAFFYAISTISGQGS